MLCRCEGEVYGCASQEFLNWFAASPQAYLVAMHQQALELPACIGLLDLQDAFPDLSLDSLIKSVPLQKLQVSLLYMLHSKRRHRILDSICCTT